MKEELHRIHLPNTIKASIVLSKVEKCFRPLKITTSTTLSEVMMNEGEQRVITFLKNYLKSYCVEDIDQEV